MIVISLYPSTLSLNRRHSNNVVVLSLLSLLLICCLYTTMISSFYITSIPIKLSPTSKAKHFTFLRVQSDDTNNDENDYTDSSNSYSESKYDTYTSSTGIDTDTGTAYSSSYSSSSDSSSSSWSVTDKWDTLSIENPDNAAIESRKQFDLRLARGAYNPSAESSSASVSSLYSTIDKVTSSTTSTNTIDPELIEQQVLDNFINEMYNTDISNDVDTDNDNFVLNEDTMSNEIALLVRCNERPDTILIEQGRLLPQLTTEQLYNVSQLVQLQQVSSSPTSTDETGSDSDVSAQSTTSTIKWIATPFLQNAVQLMYEQHITTSIKINGHEEIIKKFDSVAVASWLSTALQQMNPIIGQHDQRVNHIIAKYSTYGTYYLTYDELLNLYVSTIIGTTTTTNIPTNLKQLQKQRSTEIHNVWNDLLYHNIAPPNELQYKIDIAQLQSNLGFHESSETDTTFDTTINNDNDMLDECQLLDDDNMNEGHYKTSKTSDRQGRSSHELVTTITVDSTMTHIIPKNSGTSTTNHKNTIKVPLYIDDGQFVFIDEETCIGCMQCVSVSPSSFKIISDTGRARCYNQRSMKTTSSMGSSDIVAAINTCPIQECMHVVSFSELIELENARDYSIYDDTTTASTSTGTGSTQNKNKNNSDRDYLRTSNKQGGSSISSNSNSIINGDSSTSTSDHRHFGHTETRGYIPRVPLHVSRMSSDANHRSSFYHFIKNKCFRSSNCPQRGCYDCPRYSSDPDSNPYYQEKVLKANHLRAQYFIQTGIADPYRTTADL